MNTTIKIYEHRFVGALGTNNMGELLELLPNNEKEKIDQGFERMLKSLNHRQVRETRRKAAVKRRRVRARRVRARRRKEEKAAQEARRIRLERWCKIELEELNPNQVHNLLLGGDKTAFQRLAEMEELINEFLDTPIEKNDNFAAPNHKKDEADRFIEKHEKSLVPVEIKPGLIALFPAKPAPLALRA